VPEHKITKKFDGEFLRLQNTAGSQSTGSRLLQQK